MVENNYDVSLIEDYTDIYTREKPLSNFFINYSNKLYLNKAVKITAEDLIFRVFDMNTLMIINSINSRQDKILDSLKLRLNTHQFSIKYLFLFETKTDVVEKFIQTSLPILYDMSLLGVIDVSDTICIIKWKLR